MLVALFGDVLEPQITLWTFAFLVKAGIYLNVETIFVVAI